MGPRRTAGLVAAPLLTAAGALAMGGIAAAAFTIALTPYDKPMPGASEAGRAVFESTLGDLTDPLRLAPVAAGVLLAELTWIFGIGITAQRLFPRRRRWLPGVAAVVLSLLGAWIAIGLVAGDGGLWGIAVHDAVRAIAVAGVLAALLVLIPAGMYWAPARVPARAAAEPVRSDARDAAPTKTVAAGPAATQKASLDPAQRLRPRLHRFGARVRAVGSRVAERTRATVAGLHVPVSAVVARLRRQAPRKSVSTP